MPKIASVDSDFGAKIQTLLLFPFFFKIPLKQVTNEEIETMKEVFVKLEIPFDVEWEKARLLSIFSRRKRKIGFILRQQK